MKTNKGKQLMAAVAVLALALCVCVVAMPSDVEGVALTTPAEDATEVTSLETLNTALEAEAKNINITGNVVFTEAEDAYVLPAGVTVWITGENGKITINSGATLNIAGTVYNNVGTSDSNPGVINNGVVNFTGDGIFYSVSAVGPDTGATQVPAVAGFFTSTDDAVTGATGYQHIYAADIDDLTQYVVNNKYTDGNEGKFIYSYGATTIDAAVTLTNIGLIVGGVDVKLTSELTIAEGVSIAPASIIVKDGSSITGNYSADVTKEVSQKTDAEKALTDDNVDTIVYTGEAALDVEGLNKALVVTTPSVVNNANLAQGGSIEIGLVDDAQDITLSAALTINGGEGNSVVLPRDFKATAIGFYYGSAGVNIEGVDGTFNIQFSGDGKIYGSIADGAEVTITPAEAAGTATVTIDSQGLVLGNSATLTIAGGVTLNAGSNLKLAEDATSADLINSGTLSYTTIPSGIDLTNNGTLKIEGAQGTENIISTNQPIEGTYYLTGDTTILEGVTVTIGRNATLDLMGYDLIVKGNLVIERNGVVTSSFSDESDVSAIVLTRTGSVQNNNGIIGDKMPIRVANGEVTAADGSYTQYVEMWGVSGVSFEFVREVTYNPSTQQNVSTYNMAVSGDISRVSGVDTHELTLVNVDISANMTIGNSVSFYIEGETVVDNDVAFVNNGDYMEIASTRGVFKLLDGASATINSITSGKITVDVGEVDYGNNMVAANSSEASVEFVVVSGSDNQKSGVVGMTISVGRVTLPDPEDDTKSIVEQRIYVNGSLDVELNYRLASGADSPEGDVKFTGAIYVSESLYIPADVNVNEVAGAPDYYFDVSEAGTITVEDEGSALKYSGARYVVETTENNVTVETTYYTSFDAAMGQIATAQDGVIFIAGEYEIAGTYEVADEQEIDIDADRYTNTAITVGETGQITVTEDGTIDNAAFALIEGRVVALAGTGYRPAEGQGIYAVVTVDADTNDTTYSGFKIALDNATAGQTITIVDTAEYDGNMVVPAQVTVNVDEQVKLTVLGNVTVEAQGTLNLDAGAILYVGKADDRDYTITVNGTLDATEGGSIAKTTGCTGDVDLYSVGTTSVANANSITNVDINAAAYNDGDYVYTSVANAVAYAEENALASVSVYGIFTEAGAVESDGVKIVIQTGANVTMGNVTINNATIGGEGDYTATVTGLSGVGDAAVNSTVSVNKTSATIASVVSMDATGASTYALTIDAIDGNTTVSAGTVDFVGNDITTDRTNTLTINSGATLLVPEKNTALTIDGGEYILNAGTIRIEGSANIDADTVLSGTVVVAEDGRLVVSSVPGTPTVVTVVGDLTVETDGTMSVDGQLLVGEVPDLLGQTTTGTITGNVTLVGNNVVYVFAGASVADAEFLSATSTEVETTTYVINGIEYATAYTMGDSAITGMDAYAVKLKDLTTYEGLGTKAADLVWYAGETKIASQFVGDYDQVTAEVKYNSVEVKVSVGSQISIVIDGVVYRNTSDVPLTIGTHTVSATVNPGFTGDVTITFNGQAVTNGQFEVTSEMIDSINDIILSATGQLSQDTSAAGGDSGSDDGMGLTDYLLIILVVLIVIMAIMVAMRLMRS